LLARFRRLDTGISGLSLWRDTDTDRLDRAAKTAGGLVANVPCLLVRSVSVVGSRVNAA
jgi:hypothetical protein